MADDHYDLSRFGWDGCTIPTNLHNICEFLPSWNELKILRPAQLINSAMVYFPHTFFKEKEESYMPAFIKGALDGDGGYAQVFKGRRGIFKLAGDISGGAMNLVKTESFKEVCIKEVAMNITPDEDVATPHTREKTYEDEILAILYEAFLHALLYKTLEAEGFPSAVPYLYEVVAHTKTKALPKNPCDFKSVWMTMEFIQGSTLENYFRRHFIPVHKAYRPSSLTVRTQEKKNELLLLDVMIQLAFYLQILQEKVRFNHRDMKINNVFIRYHGIREGWKRNLTIPVLGEWACRTDTVLIDFGFSCISCGEGFENPRATLIGAGSWFKPEHDCLKYGRDLAQFLYSIHCFFPLQDYISPALYKILHRVMRAEKAGHSVDLLKGLDSKGNPITSAHVPRTIQFNHGIYIFLRESDVDVPECRPSAFFEAIKPFVQAMGTT